MSIKKSLCSFLVLSLWCFLVPETILAQKPVMTWDFESIRNRLIIETDTNIADTVEGNFEEVDGVAGKGLRLDGFTTRVIRKDSYVIRPGAEFTIDAWVSLGQYPLNWCPLLTTESDEVKGYRLMIGPRGQVSFETSIDEHWISCTGNKEAIPLRKWIKITADYVEYKELKLYINGELVSRVEIAGSLIFPNKTSCILGMVTEPKRPSNTIRTWGTVPTFFGLDGIIDEVKVYDYALTPQQVKDEYLKHETQHPDIPERRLPVIENVSSRFGAYYTKLKYYPGWDNLWPVDEDPDVVVCFEDNPVKMIFWRGIRYGPCWVSENNMWMTDQSLETWGVGDYDTEGCFEHMQDRHCRFSHVRIIESSPARAVVHWRYAPVSSHNNTWLPDPKTGWECWVDEYYYIYPDGSAIRKVSWDKGTTGRALQLQESLPLTQPGQNSEDVLENEYLTVTDYDNNSASDFISVTLDPPERPSAWTGEYTVQQINFKSENKPYICFEPGNHMWIRWIGGEYNHFPVNQARSDGRWAKTTDRPTHFLSSPCSDPVIHESGKRLYWIGLYGMNNMNMNELLAFGRSWAHAPVISLGGDECINTGYDRSERCYKLIKKEPGSGKIEFIIEASAQSPAINPAFIVKNWNSDRATVIVNGERCKKCKIGINHKLEGDDLVIYLPLEELIPIDVTILP